MVNDVTLDLLIQIRDDLAGLTNARQGIKDTKQEAESFSTLMRQGFGIGTGMQLAAEGIGLLKDSLIDTVKQAFELATQVRQGSDALGISTEAYQVIRVEMAKAGVDMSRFSMAVAHQTETLAMAESSDRYGAFLGLPALVLPPG